MKKISLILAAIIALGSMAFITGCGSDDEIIVREKIETDSVKDNSQNDEDAENELYSIVSASQVIASSAYASGDGMFTNNNTGASIEVVADSTEIDGDFTPEALDCAIELAEAEGTLYKVSVSDGLITFVQYETENGIKAQYSDGNYEIVDSFD